MNAISWWQLRITNNSRMDTVTQGPLRSDNGLRETLANTCLECATRSASSEHHKRLSMNLAFMESRLWFVQSWWSAVFTSSTLDELMYLTASLGCVRKIAFFQSLKRSNQLVAIPIDITSTQQCSTPNFWKMTIEEAVQIPHMTTFQRKLSRSGWNVRQWLPQFKMRA